MLSGVHQQGTVPKIIAKFRSGGQRLTVTGRVQFQQTRPSGRRSRPASRRRSRRAAARRRGRRDDPARGANGDRATGAAGSLGGSGGAGGNGAAAAAGSGLLRLGRGAEVPAGAVPQLPRTVVTPQQTIQQLDRPAADEHQELDLLDRRRRPVAARHRARHAGARHERPVPRPDGDEPGAPLRDLRGPQKLKLGLEARHQRDEVHGRRPRQARRSAARPPTCTCRSRRCRSSRARRALVNVALVRASDSTSVGSVQKEIQTQFPNAQVASSKQVADQISGSLVDASNLSHRLGVALAVLAALAAFLLAALLTLSSVGKRTRELGTLKALGWTQVKVVRQVVGESLDAGHPRRPPRRSCSASRSRPGSARSGRSSTRPPRPATPRPSSGSARSPRAPSPTRSRSRRRSPARCCSLGFLLAVVGGLLAGTAGAFRAAPAPPRRRAEDDRVSDGEANGRSTTSAARRSLQQGRAQGAGGRTTSTSRSRRASSSRSRGRAGRARRRCSSSSARSTGRPTATCTSRDATSPGSATASSPSCGCAPSASSSSSST